jgi:hypothetical protein
VTAQPSSAPPEEAARLIEAADAAGLTLRAMGGVAVALTCPSAGRPPLARDYGDVDLAGRSGERREVEALLEANGYVGDRETNLLHGRRRLIYWDAANSRQLDVMFDRLVMCHEIEFEGLAEAGRTLPLADLLMTKLQVFETTDKDFRDTIALLIDHAPTGPGEEGIAVARLIELTQGDWGLWRTSTEVLRRAADYARALPLAAEDQATVSARAETLLTALEEAPKSRRWRMRAKVGDRVQWYELPEAAKASAAG